MCCKNSMHGPSLKVSGLSRSAPTMLTGMRGCGLSSTSLCRSLAHTTLGLAYVLQKQHARAIAEGERAITLGPNYADGYAWLGAIFNFALPIFSSHDAGACLCVAKTACTGHR